MDLLKMTHGKNDVPELPAHCPLCNRRSVVSETEGTCASCQEIIRLYHVLRNASPVPFDVGDDGRPVRGEYGRDLLWWQTIGADGHVTLSGSVWGLFVAAAWFAWLTFMVLR